MNHFAESGDAPNICSAADNSANAEKFGSLFGCQLRYFRKLRVVSSLQSLIAVNAARIADDIKIERISEGPKSVVRLSGRLQAEHVDELKAQLEGDWRGIQLDLEGVTLVDVEVV